MSPSALALVAAPFFGQATGAKQGAHATTSAGMVINTMRLGGQMRLPLLYKTAGVVALAYFVFCQCAKVVDVVIRASGGE